MLLGGGAADDRRLARPARRRDVRRRRRRVPRRRCGPRWPGCCSRSRSSTTSPPPGRWSPTLPDVTAVTRDGDVLGAHFASGGSSPPAQPASRSRPPSTRPPTSSPRRSPPCERLGFDIVPARGASGSRPSSASTSRWPSCTSPTRPWPPWPRSSASYGSQARVGPRRGRAARPRPSPTAEEARDQDLAGLAELEARLAARRGRPRRGARHRRARAAGRGGPRRPGRPRWTPGWRCAPPRSAPAPCTAAPTRCCAAAQAEREARARAAERRERLIREGRAAEAVGVAVAVVLGRLEVSIAPRPPRRAPRSSRPAAAASRSCSPCARRLRDLAREHDELVNSVHRDEMARTQQRMRIEQLEERALEELGLDADALVADYGPDQPGAAVHRRASPTRRRTRARAGAVRPRGAAEAAARRRAGAGDARQGQPAGAGGVLRARGAAQVPHRAARGPQGRPARTCSTSSARSTRGSSRCSPRPTPTSTRAFDATLHPAVPRRRGPAGAHRPRPTCSPPASRSRPGRPARRSSGSRCSPAASGRWSRWRSWSRCSRPGPSPFYILDEVEAALDDTNLGRLLEIYEELRENSQLLVITHQKRTMEVGDALYGVTMRGDGVSAVISQRLRERRAWRDAPAPTRPHRAPRPTRADYVVWRRRPPGGPTTTPTAT